MLGEAGVDATLTGGFAVAETAYPDPDGDIATTSTC